jgi:hypothetical protein
VHDFHGTFSVLLHAANLRHGTTDRLDPSGKFVEDSTKQTGLEITGYLIRYSTVLWLLELQARRSRKV